MKRNENNRNNVFGRRINDCSAAALELGLVIGNRLIRSNYSVDAFLLRVGRDARTYTHTRPRAKSLCTGTGQPKSLRSVSFARFHQPRTIAAVHMVAAIRLHAFARRLHQINFLILKRVRGGHCFICSSVIGPRSRHSLCAMCQSVSNLQTV